MLSGGIILSAIVFGLITWKILPFLYNYIRQRSILKKQLKGPEDKFLLGHALLIERDPTRYHYQMLRFTRQYKDEKMFLLWFGTIPHVVCHHPESAEKVLGSQANINKSDLYRFIKPWLGNGLVVAQGHVWRAKRKLLTPAFHFKILNNFVPLINKFSRVFTDIIVNRSKPDGKELDVYPLITMAALDIISETAMGVSINAQIQSDSAYIKAIVELAETFMARIKNPLLQNDFLFSLTSMGRRNARNVALVHGFIEKIIKEKKEYYEITKKQKGVLSKPSKEGTEDDDDIPVRKRGLAFLDLLLEYQDEQKTESNTGYKITDADIRDEVDTFMFAGHDTTSLSMTWTTFLLAKHKEEQRKVQEELDEIFQDDPDRDITADDIGKMVYMDLVIKESLRLFPSIPIIARKIEEDTDICGYRIPKGANAMVMPFAIHLREDLYDYPEEFIPERFSLNASKNFARKHAYAYIPFSAGPRNCIGAKFSNLEQKTLLAHLFRKFNASTDLTVDDIAPASKIVLHPSNPVNIKFTLR